MVQRLQDTIELNIEGAVRDGNIYQTLLFHLKEKVDIKLH